jgi:hypothetical protein
MTLSSDADFDSQIATVAGDGSFEFGGLSKGVHSIAPGVRGINRQMTFTVKY